MSYRKITADKIFDGYRVLEDQVLIVTEDGTIEAGGAGGQNVNKVETKVMLTHILKREKNPQ